MLTILAAALLVTAAPPKVVHPDPDNADVIDPSVTALVVRFDQDMKMDAHSLCGGGASFPPLSGKPQWVTPRELRVPVKLAPGRTYSLSFNCPSAKNFQSAAGDAAVVYPLSFRTLAPGEAAPTLSPADAAGMVTALRRAIDERYSYRDLHALDWDALFAEYGPEMGGATTPAAFARAAAAMLARNQDLHLSISVGGVRLHTGSRSVSANIDVRLLARSVPRWTETPTVAVGRFDDGLGYILINTWGPASPADLKPVFDALDSLQGARGLVVDVRTNSGGDESLARTVAACFVEAKLVYSKSLIRDPASPDGWSGPFPRVVEPGEAHRFSGRVAVLVGPACMSSCESFILMMQQPGSRETFGATTWGSSGNPRPHDLGHGVRVFLPSWKDLTADGQLVEGVGLRPDHPVPWVKGDDDPVLAAALAWLRGEGGRQP